MFGHLKAEDFMNLMEGSPLAQKRRVHLESCARCAETLKSVEAIRNQVTATQMTVEEHISEPDWAEFRGDVRNALLSRSVKRETTNRNWLGGMGWKPAAAWGFSMVLVFGLMTSAVLWNQDSIEPAGTQFVPVEETMGAAGTIDAIASMGQTDVFDDLIQLDAGEAESLRLLLEDLTRKSGNAQ
jgi:hypothetical protein